jgi:hypothetical protein
MKSSDIITKQMKCPFEKNIDIVKILETKEKNIV